MLFSQLEYSLQIRCYTHLTNSTSTGWRAIRPWNLWQVRRSSGELSSSTVSSPTRESQSLPCGGSTWSTGSGARRSGKRRAPSIGKKSATDTRACFCSTESRCWRKKRDWSSIWTRSTSPSLLYRSVSGRWRTQTSLSSRKMSIRGTARCLLAWLRSGASETCWPKITRSTLTTSNYIFKDYEIVMELDPWLCSWTDCQCTNAVMPRKRWNDSTSGGSWTCRTRPSSTPSSRSSAAWSSCSAAQDSIALSTGKVSTSKEQSIVRSKRLRKSTFESASIRVRGI